MIKAMCRLSCGVCDKMEDHPDDGSRRKAVFRNIEQLKGHLFHKHRLMMCSLCLEGRKVFICEQKLYTRSQLTQHTNTGDSEVDGTESERGGFMGHPRCEFCGTPFYGDNELYTHMSIEHFICHICQRQHPGHYDYYKNYDDLEIHFRHDHFLCEDEDCLGKKFIVFQSETELKRHNTLEHGGRVSRSKRSAALQIPTSFRYQRSSEQDHRRGRGRAFQRDISDNQLSLAIQESLETANTAPFSTRTATDHGESADVEILVPPLESLTTTVSEPPSRYLHALSHNSTSATLGEVSFPPLTVNPGGSQQNPRSDVQPKRTMAALLRHQGNRKGNALSSAPAPSGPASSRMFAQPEINSLHDWPSINVASGSESGPGLSRPAIEIGHDPPERSISAQSGPSLVTDSLSTASLISSRMSGSTSRICHSLSASNLSECGSLDSSSGDFPQLSVAQTHYSPSIDHTLNKVKDVQTANKSLVEKIRPALGFDEEKFIAFREISGEYRQGSMDAETYLAHAVQFGLSHLVPELASLLPNPQKQKALIEAYHVYLVESAPRENGWNNGIRLKNSKDSKKGKGKSVGSGNSAAENSLAEKIISTVNELQSNHRPLEEAVPVLSKDGYRSDQGKSKAMVDYSRLESSGPGEFTTSKSDSFVVEANQKSGTGDWKGKQKKKTSKFHRVRLGDGSVEALLDLKSVDHDPDSGPGIKDSAASSGSNVESLPARGVWRNGGGQKLVMMTSREPKK